MQRLGICLGISAVLLASGAAQPATAKDRKPPVIVGAVIGGAPSGKTDRLVLTYSERIQHRLDRSQFPFRVGGYAITKVNWAFRSRQLVILLKAAPPTDRKSVV